MQRLIVSVLTIATVLAIVGYAAGFFTGEVHREDACLLCRATRYSGQHYGFSYERIEDSSLTAWYRQNIDPQHGLDPQHPHSWEQSACTVKVKPGFGSTDYLCNWVAPIFLLRPEIELFALQQIPDKTTQVGLIHSLNSPSRKTNTRRIRRLIEYYYIDQHQVSWNVWWRKNAALFGMSPSPTARAAR